MHRRKRGVCAELVPSESVPAKAHLPVREINRQGAAECPTNLPATLV